MEMTKEELHKMFYQRFLKIDGNKVKETESFISYIMLNISSFNILSEELVNAMDSCENNPQDLVMYLNIVAEVTKRAEKGNTHVLSQCGSLLQKIIPKIAETKEKSHISLSKQYLQKFLANRIFSEQFIKGLIQEIDVISNRPTNPNQIAASEYIKLMQQLEQNKKEKLELKDRAASAAEHKRLVIQEIQIRERLNTFHFDQFMKSDRAANEMGAKIKDLDQKRLMEQRSSTMSLLGDDSDEESED